MPRLALVFAALPALAFAADTRTWVLRVDGDGAILTDGSVDAGGVGTSLTCAGGEGKVEAFVVVSRRLSGRVAVRVASGATSGVYSGHADRDETDGGAGVTVNIPIASPVMAAFARTGALRFAVAGETVRDPPIPAAKAAGLIRVCRR